MALFEGEEVAEREEAIFVVFPSDESRRRVTSAGTHCSATIVTFVASCRERTIEIANRARFSVESVESRRRRQRRSAARQGASGVRREEGRGALSRAGGVRQTLSGRRQPLEGAVFGNKQTCLVRRLSDEWGPSLPPVASSPTTFPHGCEKESGAPPEEGRGSSSLNWEYFWLCAS